MRLPSLVVCAVLALAARCVAADTVLMTVKAVTGDVEVQQPGTISFSPIASGQKFPVGASLKTGPSSTALVSLLPGFAVKISGNSYVTFSSVNYENTSPPRRSVLVDLHSGRLVALLERYYPGRTSFFIQTGELGEGDGKDKTVANGGAWGPGSCGAVSVTADSGASRITQVAGSGTWTEPNGSTSQLPTGDTMTDSNGGDVSNPTAIAGSAAAADDKAFAVGAVRDAISDGLIDPQGCPGFSGFPVPGYQSGLPDSLLGLPLNLANAGLPTSTGVATPNASPGSSATPTPTPVPTPPIISPSSLSFDRTR